MKQVKWCGGDFGFIFAGEFTGGERSLGRMVCGMIMAHASNQCGSGSIPRVGVIYGFSPQGPVSRKSRNFTGHIRVSQFPLYFKKGEDLSRQNSQLFFFLLP